MIGDLHCHSTMSDGSTNVDKIIDYAIAAGLDFISVTDHDTMAGVERAVNFGKRKGLKVIPGVEITAFDNKRERMVHLLCYMPKRMEKLEKLMKSNTEERRRAVIPVIEEAAKKYPITYDDVVAAAGDSQCVYRQHIIRALMDRGYTYAVFAELYDIFRKIPYKPNFPDVWETVKILNETGGVVCLAHPGRYDSIELAWELADAGLIQAIEISHPSNSESDRAEIEKIVRKYWLVPTTGSDYHGFYSATPHPLGTCTMPGEALDALIKMREEINK